MIALLVGLFLLSWISGRARGLLGGLVGGFLGALVLTGMATAASRGDLAGMYSPGDLASNAIAVAVVAAPLAAVVPYATGFASMGWGAGALLAAIAAARTGQVAYVVPLAAHLLAAAAVVCLARRRARCW